MNIRPGMNPTSFVRIADALESIAMSLEKIANPPVVVEAKEGQTEVTLKKYGTTCVHRWDYLSEDSRYLKCVRCGKIEV